MLRLVRSALRTADRLVQTHSSSHTAKLKQPLNNFIHNLRGGGTHTSLSGASRGLSTSAKLPYTIPTPQSTLSFPARVALGRSFAKPFVPRTPALPRCVTQVGLGTARNFSSTRHVFQNLVDNVPIAGRAWYEAGWEVKNDKKRSVMRRTAKKAKKARLADKAKAQEALMASTVSNMTAGEDDLTHYFATAASPTDVTTYLTVPLYPTSQRRPLPVLSDTLNSSRLLPLAELKDLHGDHSLHAIRVSSLFTRLDTADVWSKGVECECYGGAAMPTALQVIFHGWTKEMVLEVIGEAGKGWCELTEELASPIEEELDTRQSPSPDQSTLGEETDPMAMTFVIPTLDFSSSFPFHNSSLHEDIHRTPSPGASEWTPFSTLPSSPALSAVTEESMEEIREEMLAWSDEQYEVKSIHSSISFSSAFMSRDSPF